jgi:AcrR family transcriptional regulator
LAGTITRRSQQERSQQTVGQVVDAARELFGTSGYAATSLGDVAARAGLSKGALYHHFPEGKPDLFRAVFEREQAALARRVVRASRLEPDPWDAFFEGCRAFVEASLDLRVRQITLLDAPAVLGWHEMRALEAPHSFAILRAGLRQAVDDGRLHDRDPNVLAHLVLGAMCEGVELAASSRSPRATTRTVLRELRILLTG